MRNWARILLFGAFCGAFAAVTTSSDEMNDRRTDVLYRLLRSTPDIDNINTDRPVEDLDVREVDELWNNVDVSFLMNMDEREKQRLGIHSKSYCHCHNDHCRCCRIIYLFWKIPIFKACIGIWYEGKDFVMKLKVYGITLVSHRLPLSHQKPVCARVMGSYDLCAELYNVKIKGGVVHACLKLTKPVELDLKCFTLHSPHKQVDEDELVWTDEVDSALMLEDVDNFGPEV